MLQSGAIMGRIFQPHYSHVPYTLQFMMDYNLQGMNLIHLSHCLFRRRGHVGPSGDHEDWEANEDPKKRLFFEQHLPTELISPEEAKGSSTTELEIDSVAADIMNNNIDLMQSISQSSLCRHEDVHPETVCASMAHKKMMNPGLEALWGDERSRRIEMGINENDPLSPPDSPTRDCDR